MRPSFRLNFHLLTNFFSPLILTIITISLNIIFWRKTSRGENTSYIVIDMIKIIQSFKAMRDRYQDGLYLPTPYQQAISYLYNGDIDNFVDIIGSLMNDVPYTICKIERDEGYYHTLFHVITSLLGFRPISEKATIIGRMDMRIETPDAIYILEFNYSDNNKDMSNDAFQQILDRNYGLQDHISLRESMESA